MTTWILIDEVTGEFVAGPLLEEIPAPGFLNVEASSGWPDSEVWDKDTRTFKECPRVLKPRDVLNLYTGPERRRILTSEIPEVRELVAYLLTDTKGIVSGSIEHQQGTGLLAALGFLDSPERAQRIIGGLPPLLPEDI